MLLIKIDFISAFHLFCYLYPPIQRTYPYFSQSFLSTLQSKCRQVSRFTLGLLNHNKWTEMGIFNKHTSLRNSNPF